jgi:hypothetical protein
LKLRNESILRLKKPVLIMAKTLCIALLFLGLNMLNVPLAKCQNIAIPQKEFRVFTDDSINVEKDSQKKIDVLVLRSKRFKRKVRMDVTSSLPQGVDISFDPRQGNFDSCVATINVSATAKPGTYLVIISGTIKSKSIGRVLKLTVADEDMTGHLRTLYKKAIKGSY